MSVIYILNQSLVFFLLLCQKPIDFIAPFLPIINRHFIFDGLCLRKHSGSFAIFLFWSFHLKKSKNPTFFFLVHFQNLIFFIGVNQCLLLSVGFLGFQKTVTGNVYFSLKLFQKSKIKKKLKSSI